jgi:hypothetical protein
VLLSATARGIGSILPPTLAAHFLRRSTRPVCRESAAPAGHGIASPPAAWSDAPRAVE